ncbi:MAG: PilZ domain-containing protein [Candidatus Acidiferrales bacterium]
MSESTGTPSSEQQYRDRRSVPRFNFIASVDLTEPASDMRIAGRISEISRKGCYVDILNTLPVGTLLHLRITRDQGSFSSKGKIIYVHEAMGMGVGFVDVAEEQLKILDSWLAELAG